jgi:excisionase family DNA binding protein
MIRQGKSKTWDLVHSGQIRSVKQGWSRRIPVAAVDEYIARLEREQEQEQAAGGAAS